MALRRQILCINKTNRTDPHERIARIGGADFSYTLDQAITGMEQQGWQFYVARNGLHVDVEVETRLGRKHLKTHDDGKPLDNLLALPECR